MNLFLPEGRLTDETGMSVAKYTVAQLKEAYENSQVLEGRVILCDRDHNLHVDLGAMKGIVPRAQGALGIEDGTVRDIALISKVNKNICFKIIDFRKGNGVTTAILSRKDVQREAREAYIDKLEKGSVIDARVTHLEKFGAFVDIGAGINALIPIDMISISRIPHPGERFYEGEDIKAVVRSIDDGKITLSHRELLGTWKENAELFSPCETVPGIIRSVEDYGVFVELTPNLAGLAELVPKVCAGQKASVYIKSILPERMKIKLVIVDAFDASYEKSVSRYFFSGDKMDYWRYSPDESPKIIDTYF